MTTSTESPSYAETAREAVPAGSFVYGQAAAIETLDLAPESWGVATNCAKPKDEADNGRSGFDTVLVVHFIHSGEQAARETAERLASGGNVGPVTLIRPAAPVARKPKTAYQHAQAIGRALRASERAAAGGTGDGIHVLSGKRHAEVFGYGEAPAILWEEGPYEWAITFTGNLGSGYGEAVQAAYDALRADGFYLECSNSFTLAVYVA